jgi:hypothetical protein
VIEDTDDLPQHSLKEGMMHTFEDGNKLEIIRINERDERRGGASVTYFAYQGPGIPQKLILPLVTFLEIYGYLFE